MFIYYNDYFRDMMEQKIGSKPIDKVEIELSAGVWTDVTDEYLGGATFDQEKERAPDKISAGDTTYSFDNSDNIFTPTDSGSIFFNTIFEGKKIRFSEGFFGVGVLLQSVMTIYNVKWDHDEQICYIFAREITSRLIDENFNAYPSGLVPIPGAGNTGNGTITEIGTLPLAVGTENWTLTCTTGGGDGAAIFEVLGSVSGDIGDATSGTEFVDATAGIRFTISAGGTVWVAGGSPDTFTFSTKQYPEFTTMNPVKIVWNLLTGYDFDTDVQSDWSDRVIELDSTQSVDNTDINYTSFLNAISDVTNVLTGYIPYDKNAAEAIEELIIHFLGSIYVDTKGRIGITAFRPSFGALLIRNFSDEKKVYEMDAEEELARIINKVTVFLKRSASFAWSTDEETTDDVYVAEDTTSITTYGIKNPFVWTDFWFSANKAAQGWFADRLSDKFGKPPLEIEFITGLDGMRTNLADQITFTDSRTNFSNKILEAFIVKRDFESQPKEITIRGWDASTDSVKWTFLGSSADEGDGISPQNSDFDSATDSDKQFCYLSTTGSVVEPMYFLWGD